jgi:hypothetical protein
MPSGAENSANGVDEEANALKPRRPDGRELVERLGIAPEDLPLMICPTARYLQIPVMLMPHPVSALCGNTR